jgi:hypothetical protein
VDRRLWGFEHALLQFDFPYHVIDKLAHAPKNMTIETMRDMSPKEIGTMIRFQKEGARLYQAAHQFPLLQLTAQVLPITRTVLRINLTIEAGNLAQN